MQLGEIVWNGSFIKLVAMTDWRLQQQVWVLKSRLAHVAVSSMMVSTPRPVICIYIYICGMGVHPDLCQCVHESPWFGMVWVIIWSIPTCRTMQDIQWTAKVEPTSQMQDFPCGAPSPECRTILRIAGEIRTGFGQTQLWEEVAWTYGVYIVYCLFGILETHGLEWS